MTINAANIREVRVCYNDAVVVSIPFVAKAFVAGCSPLKPQFDHTREPIGWRCLESRRREGVGRVGVLLRRLCATLKAHPRHQMKNKCGATVTVTE